MENREKKALSKVSKTSLLLGLLIEVFLCLLGLLFQAVLIEIGLKYFVFALCVIMIIYFIGRNYFFHSISSIVLGIRWKKSKFILLKNLLYVLVITVLIIQKKIAITIIAGLAISFDMFFLFAKQKWFIDDLFNLKCYKSEKEGGVTV